MTLPWWTDVGGEVINRVRRRVAERTDQALTLARWKLLPPQTTAPAYDGDPRFALLTVNRSTTRYLKLLLLTLIEQEELGRLLHRIVVCDNDSRDGGADFLRRLAHHVPALVLVTKRWGRSHAHGMRACMNALSGAEAALPTQARSNLLLFCDTDVVFRNPDTLGRLGRLITESGAAGAGELRDDLYPYPEAQASFLAVRADWCARPDVLPWVDHGAPSYWLQRSIWRAGGQLAHFPSNFGGYILHRGRAGVAAARAHEPLSAYATVPRAAPHFMGVPGGPEIWAAIEGRRALLLEPAREADLLALLVPALAKLDSHAS